MSVARQIRCDIKDCENESTEAVMGDGWEGWGMLSGMQKEDIKGEIITTELGLCPNHLGIIFEFIRNLSEGK